MKRAIVLFVVSILIFTFSQSAYSKDVDPKKQANKLITAVQNDDFQTVFNMFYEYVLAANVMKAENPDFLFKKKLSEFYEKSRKEFHEGSGLARYFPPKCNWNVIEIKRKKLPVAYIKGLTDVYSVYVSVSYGDIVSSPILKVNSLPDLYSPIKDTVVELAFISGNGLFVGSTFISDATVSWSLPVKINDVKYEYGIYNNNPALIISFSVDGGNPQWVGGKTPYKYNVVVNGTDLESFVSKYKGYSQVFEENNLQKTIILGLDNRDRSVPDLRSEDEIKASFRWPRGFASPVNLKIQVTDSSNPVKSDSCELKVEALAASDGSVQDKAQGAVNKLKGIMGF